MAYLECGDCGQEWTREEVEALEHTVHTCHAGETRKGYEARIAKLETTLRKIQQWDCLNPPRADLLADLPWLRRVVDDALGDSQSDGLGGTDG